MTRTSRCHRGESLQPDRILAALSSLLPSSTSLLVQLCCNSPTSTMFVFSLGEVKYQIFFQVLLNIFSKCCVHVFLVGCLLGWWRLRPLPGRCWVRVVAGPQSSAHSTSPTEAGLVQPPAPSHHHPPAQPSPPDKGGNDISRNISFSLQSEKVRRM